MSDDTAMKRWAEAQTSIGQILTKDARRDALHFAVAPMEAACLMGPGDHIGVDSDGCASTYVTPLLGIVDPFLAGAVRPGERFWMFLYPNTITSLRHVWDHPSFSAEAMKAPDKDASEKWLQDFIARSDCPDYHTVIAKAINNEDSWDPGYLHFDGRDAHGEIPPEFWDHVEVVTGKKIKNRASYFSCSC